MVSSQGPPGKRGFFVWVWETTSSWAKREWSDFLRAASKIGIYALLGAASGTALVWFSKHLHWLHTRPVLDLICEHLGLGLIVAAIAVFSYEYKAHSKEALDLSRELVELLKHQGKEALDRALLHLFRTEKHKMSPEVSEAYENCTTVIMALSAFFDNQTRVTTRYASFVSGLLRQVVNRNAEALRDLAAKKMARFTVPKTAADIADDILAAQMAALEKGDRYDVVSDLDSWNNRLGHFHEATHKRVEDGVVVRRVFNLLLPVDQRLHREHVRTILKRHLLASSTWKHKEEAARYQVRLFGPEELKEALDRNALDEEDLRKAHFGLFVFAEADSVRFKVQEPDLSEMDISGQHDDLARAREVFELVWTVAKPLGEQQISVACQRFHPDPGQKPSKKAKSKKR